MREKRVLLHLDERTRRAIDPADVYFLEADGSDTLLRLRSSRRLRDARQLPEVLALFEPPVNRVLPVARGGLPALWPAFGEGKLMEPRVG